MKKLLRSWAFAAVVVAALASVIAPRAAAQGDGIIRGQILNVDGKPWTELGIQAVSDQGVKFDTKTDKDGKFSFHNLRSGFYDLFIQLPAPNKPYPVKVRVQGSDTPAVDLNFKDIVAKQGTEFQEQAKKQEEEKQKFEGMKAHFAQGNTILEQERQARTEFTKATADQRDAAKQKLADLSNQAAAEFQAAQKSAPEKDPNQHLLWAKLGEAYDIAGRNDEAAQAYQQAITAFEPSMKDKPKDGAGYYNNLGNVLARSGKIDDARSAYTKSAELDPANAAQAWRNFGISLYNAGRLKEAAEPLKKATEMDPKSAQAWYLLGASLVGSMETKKVGDKLEFIIAPGTAEAYQKAVELDPSGTWGAQAKQGLDALQQIAPGIDTKINVRKKKS
jgi:tetratricopeptide (TPR) repeat protein